MKKILIAILRDAVRAVYNRVKPQVVAITGSVGKTTTRVLLAHFLRSKYDILETRKNYNTEWGLPLSVLGMDMPKDFWEVLYLLFTLPYKIWFKTYPKMWVLEMGADRPGDIAYLTKITPPNFAIITNVEKVHLQNYSSPAALLEEKTTLVRSLSAGGRAYLNYDHVKFDEMMRSVPQNVVLRTWGTRLGADFQAEVLAANWDGLKVNYLQNNQESELYFPQFLGRVNIYPIAAALAVASDLGVNKEDIKHLALSFQPPQRRLEKVNLESGGILLDGSYNAEPSSMQGALETLAELQGDQPAYGVIGDMRELGKISQSEHLALKEYIENIKWKYLFLVGPEMSALAKVLDNNKIPFSWFKDVDTLIQNELPKLKEKDIMLVKASQSIFLDRVVDFYTKSHE
ncbi:MAG TPA: UDP-N-acetylmuramoyl-tripeptide--D-alanyl-D-alanine ligase [Candidatus Gracilibacteria bacterium]|nr:UDP-N-acetylmuramoyl-tripeptide--D-alanyl-D-alanine ligase [Candidatus Gracilibacteria bacterium]